MSIRKNLIYCSITLSVWITACIIFTKKSTQYDKDTYGDLISCGAEFGCYCNRLVYIQDYGYQCLEYYNETIMTCDDTLVECKDDIEVNLYKIALYICVFTPFIIVFGYGMGHYKSYRPTVPINNINNISNNNNDNNGNNNVYNVEII
jgi:hypothetical protein